MGGARVASRVSHPGPGSRDQGLPGPARRGRVPPATCVVIRWQTRVGSTVGSNDLQRPQSCPVRPGYTRAYGIPSPEALSASVRHMPCSTSMGLFDTSHVPGWTLHMPIMCLAYAICHMFGHSPNMWPKSEETRLFISFMQLEWNVSLLLFLSFQGHPLRLLSFASDS
jgi:hypothetical protein